MQRHAGRRPIRQRQRRVLEIFQRAFRNEANTVDHRVSSHGCDCTRAGRAGYWSCLPATTRLRARVGLGALRIGCLGLRADVVTVLVLALLAAAAQAWADAAAFADIPLDAWGNVEVG